MKKILATMILATFVLSGCNEEQTVKQLRLERTQIVNEFNVTKATLQAKIDAQAEQITALEAKVAEQTGTIEGYNNILFDIIPQNEELKKELEELKKENQALKSKQASQADPEEVKKKLEALEALRQKAVEQRQSEN